MAAYPDKYLEYLDKEMTIMGVISAASVTLGALATDHLFTATGQSYYGKILTDRDAMLCALMGSTMALTAGAFFYLQRSLLAWYYGQLALEVSLTPPVKDVDDLLSEADGWETWIRYQVGCVALCFAFVCYAAAIVGAVIKPAWGPFARDLLVIFAVLSAGLAVRWYVFSVYWYDPRPFHAWLENWWKKKKKPMRPRRTRRFRRSKVTQA